MGSVSVSSCIIMFYVCVHPAAVLNAALVNAGRGCKRPPCRVGYKQDSLQAVELSLRSQAAVQMVSKHPTPALGARFSRSLYNIMKLYSVNQGLYLFRSGSVE